MIIELFTEAGTKITLAWGLGLIMGRAFAVEITNDDTRILLPYLGEFYSDYGRTEPWSWQSWQELKALTGF